MNLENFLAKYGFYATDIGASKMVFHRGHELALEEMFSLTDYVVSSVSVESVLLTPKNLW